MHAACAYALIVGVHTHTCLHTLVVGMHACLNSQSQTWNDHLRSSRMQKRLLTELQASLKAREQELEDVQGRLNQDGQGVFL